MGRFQPPHEGHAAVIRQVIADGAIPIIIVSGMHDGKVLSGRSVPRNPFTFEQRRDMLLQTLPELSADHIFHNPHTPTSMRVPVDADGYADVTRPTEAFEALVREIQRHFGAKPEQMALYLYPKWEDTKKMCLRGQRLEAHYTDAFCQPVGLLQRVDLREMTSAPISATEIRMQPRNALAFMAPGAAVYFLATMADALVNRKAPSAGPQQEDIRLYASDNAEGLNWQEVLLTGEAIRVSAVQR